MSPQVKSFAHNDASNFSLLEYRLQSKIFHTIESSYLDIGRTLTSELWTRKEKMWSFIKRKSFKANTRHFEIKSLHIYRFYQNLVGLVTNFQSNCCSLLTFLRGCLHKIYLHMVFVQSRKFCHLRWKLCPQWRHKLATSEEPPEENIEISDVEDVFEEEYM